MKRFLAAVKLDICLQFKYGIYLVYGIITFFYILLLSFLPKNISTFLTPFIIFSDPSFLGFFFLGGLIFFEKDEGTIQSIVITPLKIEEYILSKVVSLTIVALISGFLVSIVNYKSINYFILFLAIFLTSTFFTLLGFIAVIKLKSVNEYLLASILYLSILGLPILEYFNLYKSNFFYLLPTQASLILFQSAFNHIDLVKILYAIFYLVLSILFVYKIALGNFYKYVYGKQGSAKDA